MNYYKMACEGILHWSSVCMDVQQEKEAIIHREKHILYMGAYYVSFWGFICVEKQCESKGKYQKLIKGVTVYSFYYFDHSFVT